MSTSPDKLSKNSKLLLYMVTAFSVGGGAYMVLLNLYLKELGMGEALIGRVTGLVAIGTVLTTIPLAWLCGRRRIKGILIFAVLLNVFGDFFIVMGGSEVVMQLGAIISGAGASAWMVATAPFVMRNATKNQRAKVFSYKHGLGMVGAAIAAISFGKWVDVLIDNGFAIPLAYQYILLLASASKLVACILGFFLTPHDPLPEEKRDIKDFLGARDWHALFLLVFPTFLIGLGAGLTMPFMTLYFRDRFQMGPSEIGNIFFVCQLFMALGTFLGPKISGRSGNILTIVSTQVLSLPFMFVLAFTGNFGFAVAAFFIRATLMNMGHPISR
jgi:predicted MFS family arabinose efflux permease